MDDKEPSGWFFVELFALGAVLHGFDVMTTAGLETAFGWWLAGSVIAIVGWHWNRIRPLLDPQFEKTFNSVAKDFRWWTLTIIALFVLPLIPRLIDSTFIIYNRITDPPSRVLGLTDAKRWRFIKYFQDYKPNQCAVNVSIKRSSYTDELWSEFQPLFSNSLTFNGSLDDNEKGISLLVPPKQPNLSGCAARLAEWINTQTPIKATVKEDQITPILLRGCENKCIEMQVGLN